MRKGIVMLLVVSFFRPECRGQDTTRLSLLFLGDIMQHESQIKAAYDPVTGRHDYNPCFRYVRNYFYSADLAIGNLELTLAGKPYSGYPQFSAPDELAVALKEAGLDILVTANNHSMDRGRKGVERTIAVLDSLGIHHTGTFRDTVERMNDYPLLIYKNGFSIALLNYTYGTNGIPVKKPNIVNLIDTAVIRKDLVRAKELTPDVTIVFVHWGNEYESQPSKFQKSLAEFCFAHGAQLVIGAHPHVLQPMEWRREKGQLVVYSLGNFVSGQRDRYKNGGAMVSIELNKVYLPDSTPSIWIDSANFVLEWVYRTADSSKDYYILPVLDFETDTTDVIKDEASRLAFKTFAEDSRKLLKRYNGSVSEVARLARDSSVHYCVVWQENLSEKNYSPGDFPFGLETELDGNGFKQCRSGNFRRKEEAEKYLQRILDTYPDAKIVRYVNDKVLNTD